MIYSQNKRISFSSIQSQHQIAISNAKPMPTRTGYDAKLAERSSDSFATIASDDGVVTSVNDYGMVVKYKNGEEKVVELGRHFGKSGKMIVPHDVITKLKVGDKVKAGDTIAYNPAWFTDDPYHPGKLAYRYGTLQRVALMEHPYTFEDSIAISKKMAIDTKVKTTVQKEVVVKFEQSIHRLAVPGTYVKVDDPLCIIEDSITTDTGMFDNDSIDILRNLGAAVPKSAVEGKVDKVEIYYSGDIEDMSDTLAKYTRISDRVLINQRKALGKEAFTGEVDETYRVDGNPLMVDTAVIVFSITTDGDLGVGDKLNCPL